MFHGRLHSFSRRNDEGTSVPNTILSLPADTGQNRRPNFVFGAAFATRDTPLRHGRGSENETPRPSIGFARSPIIAAWPQVRDVKLSESILCPPKSSRVIWPAG